MKSARAWAAVILSLVIGGMFPTAAFADKGTPESPEFGYGAQLNLEGNYLSNGILAVSDLQLDWVSMTFDWAAQWNDPNSDINFTLLDQTLQSDAIKNTPVLISITHAPAWAMTGEGPDSEMTLQVVIELAARYPSVRAIELFPGANTVNGWGAAPNPEHYLELIQAARNAVDAIGGSIYLPAVGLQPISPSSDPSDMDDLVYLKQLYQAGAADVLAIISLRFNELSGDPITSPSEAGEFSLRHYELVRQVMLENNHSDGILWITQLSAPSNLTDQEGDDSSTQVQWLLQAYQQLRAQLFIGVVFYQSINPSNETGQNPALIISEDQLHPFYEVYRQLIAQNNRHDEGSKLLQDYQEKNFQKDRP